MKHILSLILLLAASMADAQLEAIRTLTPEQGQEVLRPVEAKIFGASLDALPALETELLEIFQSSETTLEGKQYACRMLRHCGSDASVPVLAPELSNPELSPFVRRVFQSLETPAANEALMDALPTVGTDLQIGIIGTLGQMGSTKSVAVIAPYLGNTALQSAAITALGNIGGKKAVKALATAEVNPEFSNAWKRAQMQGIEGVKAFPFGWLSGYTDQKICSGFLDDKNIRIRCSALVGLTKANPKKAAPNVLNALDSENVRYRATAIGLLTLLPTKELSSVRLGMKTRNEVLLINELARRKATEAEDMMILAMASDNPDVKRAATQALQKVGGSASIPVLVAAAPNDDTAYHALCGLGADGTDEAILQALEQADDDKVKVKYIECLAARQAGIALPCFVNLAKGDWSRTNAAAIAGMADLVSEADFTDYAELLLGSDNPKQIQSLEKSIAKGAQRLPDANACALPLIEAFGKAEGESKYAIVRSLGSIGGGAARSMLSVALSSPDDKTKDAAIRGLASWPSLDAADQLLEIATTAEDETYQVIALRGYIRLAYTMSDPEERVDMCKKAAAATTRPAELKNIIGCVKVVKEPLVLEFLTVQLDNPDVFTEAAWAICEISSHWKLKQPSIPILERIAQTNDEKLATEAKRRLNEN